MHLFQVARHIDIATHLWEWTLTKHETQKETKLDKNILTETARNRMFVRTVI